MTTARSVAIDVLTRSFTRDGFVTELIDNGLSRAELSPQDRRFVTQLVFGVIRRRGTLDAMLKPFIQRPLNNVEPVLMDVLRLGAFQLVFLTHVPKHAAVHETVELAAHVDRTPAKGFLNGILRRIAEVVTSEFVDFAGPDTVPFETNIIPLSERSRLHDDFAPTTLRESYRKLTRPLLPDPTHNLPEYLAAAFSWPHWLVNRWLDQFGPQECFRLGFWFNSVPPLWIRVNKLKCEREEYRIVLAAKNIDVEAGLHPQSLKLIDGIPVRDLPGYADGEFAVQDHSSMFVATAMYPQPDWRVLDLCSAPGGKTTHIAELMKNRGEIIACDIETKRLETVTTLCQRLGVTIVQTKLLKDDTDVPPGPFDAALVDVPCSNTGVLGRRPEVRWRLQPNEFEHLIRLQTRLLIQALDRVKPNGVVVYSTCSIDPSENRGVVNNVLRNMRTLNLEADHTAIPGKPADGGYWARLRKGR